MRHLNTTVDLEKAAAASSNWTSECGEGVSQDAGATTLLTVREVSNLLRVSATCVYALVSAGRLACYRVGTGRGAIRIRRDDVEVYLSTCRVDGHRQTPRRIRPRLKHLKMPHSGPTAMEDAER